MIGGCQWTYSTSSYRSLLRLYKLLIKATHRYITESDILRNLIPIDLVQLQLGLCLQLLGMDEMAQYGSNKVTLPIR